MGESVLNGIYTGVTRRETSLILGGVELADVVEAVGTPTYVYDAGTIREHYRALERAFAGHPCRIHYAVKANSNLAVLRILQQLGAGADLVSGGELQRALAVGFPPDHLILSGVGKTEDELALAMTTSIGHIAVESVSELHRIGDMARQSDRLVRVGIRVNPDVTTETHPYIATGAHGTKFGLPVDQVLEAATYVRGHDRLELTVMAMHIGSQLVDPAPYWQGVRHLLELVEALERDGTTTIEALDIGGGLGIDYGDGRGMDINAFAEGVRELVESTGLTLYLEPGRFLVGNAGVLLTRVLYRKHSGGTEFIVVDSGLNDFLRPALYHASHPMVELEATGRPMITADVVGPVCETGDFLALGQAVPDSRPGDVLAILGAGAYGFSMSSNYNSRPRAAEVVIDEGRFGVARPRESVEDLFRTETPTPLE